jgi:hypothetical protein
MIQDSQSRSPRRTDGCTMYTRDPTLDTNFSRACGFVEFILIVVVLSIVIMHLV